MDIVAKGHKLTLVFEFLDLVWMLYIFRSVRLQDLKRFLDNDKNPLLDPNLIKAWLNL